MEDGPTLPRSQLIRPDLPPRTHSIEDSLPQPTPVHQHMEPSLSPVDENGAQMPSPISHSREHTVETQPRTATTRRLRRGRTLIANERDLNSTLARSVAREGPKTLAATDGLAAAKEGCMLKVKKISEECRRKNTRFRDRHFDLERSREECLFSLSHTDASGEKFQPRGVKRVHEIFDNPYFFGNTGPTAGDISQGNVGDCYFLAALATLTAVPSLIEAICVARDERVGVYGFIFFRDGEWISSVVDDQLYVKHADFNQADMVERQKFKGDERLYKHVLQKNSDALYFSSCKDPNKTWLPLLEKAYAKVHGDYESISGGITGEAVEDLTGGVITPIHTADILDPDRFWEEELTKVPNAFLFACAVQREGHKGYNGLIHNHAYSVLEAREVRGKKLVKIRNPWGSAEWKGPWSDGSSEWTPEWMEQLDHRFGDDGVFWMEYSDFLKEWTVLDRTRLFDEQPRWYVASSWLECAPAFPPEWGQVHFTLTFTKHTDAVIVLSQLDNRYFRGLEGAFMFSLEFRLWYDDEKDWIDRSTGGPGGRSTNVEIKDLKPGRYTVSVRVDRVRTERMERQEFADSLPGEKAPKFVKVGKSYDFAVQKAANQDSVEPQEGDPEDAVLVLGLRVYSKDRKSRIAGHVLGPGEVVPETVSILDPEDVHADMQSLKDARVQKHDYEDFVWKGKGSARHTSDPRGVHPFLPIIDSPPRYEGSSSHPTLNRHKSESFLDGVSDLSAGSVVWRREAKGSYGRAPSPLPHYHSFPSDMTLLGLGSPRNQRARSLTPTPGRNDFEVGGLSLPLHVPIPHIAIPPSELAWVKCENGTTWPNAILGGGDTARKTPFYIGRVEHEGGYELGYVAADIGGCAFPFEGQGQTKAAYEVLTGDESRVQWVPVSAQILAEVLPKLRPVGGGRGGLDPTNEIQELIIARARVTGMVSLVIPGKAGLSNGGLCYFASGNSEEFVENYEILVHR
ncbi:hypothetical protein HK097_009951 [Rhizophlyctis rosea]|uniref:Calpain catalytic domain-containing protein n=1 Tax=Rhizophlyctis rosea TaxID=64517 RepID=A0AAD5SKM7_9FUNG|nr:hypothetical protein HK097_009951 [Rhizophlyctis rosea]